MRIQSYKSRDGYLYARPYALPYGSREIVWLERCYCEHQKSDSKERVCGQCAKAIPSFQELGISQKAKYES